MFEVFLITYTIVGMLVFTYIMSNISVCEGPYEKLGYFIGSVIQSVLWPIWMMFVILVWLA